MIGMLDFFWHGALIGFSIAAPVGPIGVLCIRRTLAHGRLSGLASGLGAASADAVYGSVAALGLKVISDILVEQQAWLRLVGGVFLIYLGLKTLWRARMPIEMGAPVMNVAGLQDSRLSGDYASTLLLTLTNPLTILSFTAIFAGLGLGTVEVDRYAALVLVLGVFSGSATWWLLLSAATHAFGRRFLKPGALQWVNRASGLVITGFGLAVLMSILV